MRGIRIEESRITRARTENRPGSFLFKLKKSPK